jgi:hypothetical protein
MSKTTSNDNGPGRVVMWIALAVALRQYRRRPLALPREDEAY